MDQQIEELETLRKRIVDLDRKESNKELEESLSLLRATLDSTADGILVVDDKGKMISFNQKFINMWGIPESIIISKDDNQALDYVLDQLIDPQGFLAKVRELYSQPDSESYDVLEFKDGRIFERYSQPRRIEDKSIGRVWSFRDVTKQRRVEHALRESENRYRAIVESQNELICRWLPGGTLTFINEAYCRYFGKTREELVGHSFIPLIPEEDQQKVKEHFASLDRDNPIGRVEHRVLAPNGDIRWQQWDNRAIFDEEGRIVEFQSVGLDITKRIRAEEALQKAHKELEMRVRERTAELSKANLSLKEQIAERERVEGALRESESHSRTAFKSAPIAMVTANAEGRLCATNRSFQVMLGYAEDQYQNMTYLALTHPDDVAESKKLFNDLVEGKFNRFQVEKRYRTRNGNVVWCCASVSAVRDASGKFQYAIAQIENITERRQAQTALIQANKRLEQLSQHILQMQEDHYKTISRELHDNIAQSLNGVRLGLERMERDSSIWTTDRLKNYRKEIQESVSLMIRTSQAIRNLSIQMRPEILDELGLTTTLESYIRDFQERTRIQSKFRCETKHPRFPPQIEVHFYRILQESLSNISKHAQASYVTVRLKDTKRELVLTIMDNGIGFSKDHPAKGDKVARGIGLISIQERVNILKGKIEIASKPGSGTKITVRVPLSA